VIGWEDYTLVIFFVLTGLPYIDKIEELFIVMVYCMYSQHITLSTLSLSSPLFEAAAYFSKARCRAICAESAVKPQSFNQSLFTKDSVVADHFGSNELLSVSDDSCVAAAAGEVKLSCHQISSSSTSSVTTAWSLLSSLCTTPFHSFPLSPF